MDKSQTLRVGITADVLDEGSGEPFFPRSTLSILESHERIEWEFIPERGPSLGLEQLARYDAICLGAPGLAEGALTSEQPRTRILARFGVGYDHLDLAALTANGIVLTINPDGVRRPMASSILALVLTLAHRIPFKDRLLRAGRWAEAAKLVGTGLSGRTLGSLGFGNIGRELFGLAQPLGMRAIAHDPYVQAAAADGLDVALVGFDALLSEADFLVVNCPLTPATRGMLGTAAFARMRPTAFLINAARGPIVDEDALLAALRNGTIAGAGLDVFAEEPLPDDHPLLSMMNVVLTPHSICYTDECLRLLAEGAFRSAVTFLSGREPPHIVNRDVLGHPRVAAWLGENRAK
ncbi:MAG: NAD(P)-dependent oxidoreductase [Propylenella sp.]